MWNLYSVSSPPLSPFPPQLKIVSVSVRIEVAVMIREKDVAAECYAGGEMGNECGILI
jgi:hypothetical protein